MFRSFFAVALIFAVVCQSGAQLVPFFDHTYDKIAKQVEVVTRPDGSRCPIVLAKNDNEVGITHWMNHHGDPIAIQQTLLQYHVCRDMAAEYNATTGKMDVYQAGYTAGGGGQRAFLVASNEDGIKWTYTHLPENRTSQFNDIVVTQDYIYLLGMESHPTESNNALLVVLNKAGSVVRSISYNTGGQQNDNGMKLAVDGFGNTYMLIWHYDNVNSISNTIMAAHYANGNLRFALPASDAVRGGFPTDIATDGFRVYCTYNYSIDANNHRGRVVAFAIFAQQYAWDYTFIPNEPVGGANYSVQQVELTTNGNYVVCGWVKQGPGFSSVINTTYFTPSGTLKMTLPSKTSTGGPTSITNMVTRGNVAFSSGYLSYDNRTQGIIFRTSYDGVTGDSHQASFLDQNEYAEGNDVAVDDRGNAIFVGRRSSLYTGFLRKYIFGIDAVTITPNSVVAGNNVNVAVHMSEFAPQFGFGVDITSSSSRINPTFIQFGQGSDLASWDVETYGVDVEENVQVDATMSPGNTMGAALNLKPATLLDLSIPASVFSGSTFNGSVILNGKAGSDHIDVALSDNSSAITIPAVVRVMQNETSATFEIATAFVGTAATRQITATYAGVSKTRNLTLEPGIKTFVLNPSTVVSGDPTTGTVTLAGNTMNSGTVFITDNTSVVNTPESMQIAAGASQGSFQIATVPVTSTVTRQVYATAGSVKKTANLTLTPAPVMNDYQVSPNTVNAGNPAQGFVYLSGPARPGGAKVFLTTDSSVIVTAPYITVPQGSTSAGALITTGQVSQTTVRSITATYGGRSIRRSLTINPSPVLRQLTVSPSTVKGGNPSTGTATLWGAAPAGGKSVALSDNSGSVSTPSSVTIASGATSAQFTIATTAVGAQAARTVTAQLDGITKTASITLTP